MTYIVAHTAPYYPDVKEFETLEEAQEYKEKLVHERRADDGTHVAAAYIAEVVSASVFACHC